MGVNHSTKGTETVNAINNLALITGNIGRAGAAPFSITGQCNAMGTREAGFASSPARLPQVRERRRPRGAGRALERSGRADSDRARPRLSRHHRGGARAARSAALWIIATNPIVSFPNLGVAASRRSRRSSSSSCRTAFIRRRRASSRDLVLPAAIWGEKEGTYTNSERRVSKVNKAVEPPGEARSDFDIFLGLASALGVPRRAVSRLDEAARTPSRNGSACRRAACATTRA